jgi:cobalt/nickel transport protein
MKVWQRNVLLLVVALLLVGLPLLFSQGARWAGADDRSTAAIQELQPEYQPWFSSVFEPVGYERWMFGLQALIGSGVLSTAMGYFVGRYRARTGGGESDRRTALIVCVAGLVAIAALFFVQTEFGELQAFISATQGVLLGFWAFFIGYPMGLRQGAQAPVAGGQAAPGQVGTPRS